MASQLLDEFETEIAGITLVPSRGGVFEVDVNGTRIYSKAATGRHAEYPEVASAFRALSQE